MAFKTKIVKRATPDSPYQDYEYKYIVTRNGETFAVGTTFSRDYAKSEAEEAIRRYKKRPSYRRPKRRKLIISRPS